jgi:hypothetical protein
MTLTPGPSPTRTPPSRERGDKQRFPEGDGPGY